MTNFPPQENTAHNRQRCYCLNPDCKSPENPRDAVVCQSCGSQLLLLDRYRSIKPIGQGGFGRTFLTVDESQPSQTRCVIKQFFPQHQGSHTTQKAAELFRQEAQGLKFLGKHPQIAAMLAYFELDGRQYLVQEFIDGQNLAEELAENGSFDETQIRELLNSLLPVLLFVHERQMIHRDIKPENIIRRRRDRRLVIVDFGAAKYATETALGRTGTVIGSAAYTAPEQAKGKATFASDIYSLGVTCIHLMTQVPPFDLVDTSEDAWVWRQYLKTPVSPQLGQILDKMLQSATKQRYQSAEEILSDLNYNALPKAKAPAKTKKWLVAGAILALGFAGVRSLTYPAIQQVSTVNNGGVTLPFDRQDTPKQGGLYVQKDGRQQVFPLKHTEVMAKIAGNLSRVEVTQTFENPFPEPLEAVYVFPLPDEAAVDDMEIKIGSRVIRGVIKKREEAKQVYEQAKREGKTAGLLEQERDNIFTQSLANIKPGEKIDVTIRYTESLKFEKGDYEFVFPMVVGPRYIPGGSSDATGKTNGVADASRITPPVLPAGTRSGQDINVTVEIEAGVPVSGVRSTSHQIRTTQDGRIMRVQLSNETAIPNKDLVVRYGVAGQQTESAVLSQADERGGHFALYFIPSVEYQTNEIVPKDVVFLMDTSGSQSGDPLVKSKELMRQFINGLNPDDTFTIIDFANTATQLSAQPLANTPVNRAKAIAYVNRLEANGGTELMNGMNAVLNFPPAPAGRLRSIVLLTDGLIGNDEEIIAAVQKQLKPGNRLYSFGVGSSVNRFLIDRLAEEGRGASRVVLPNEPTQEVAEKFFRQINNPVLANIEVSWEGSGKKPEIYPLKSPDLFANEPLVLFGRKGDRKSGTLRIQGIAAGGVRYEKAVPVEFEGGGNSAIAQLWGRARIKDLMKQMYGGETAQGVKAVTDTALAYRLMSKYTAFVAVSSDVRVDTSSTRQVRVPVEMPEGMNVQGQSSPMPAAAPVKAAKSAPAYKPAPAPAPASAPAPSQSFDSSVPEPGQILGNILAVLLLGIYFAWKRLMALRSTPPRN
ncbi:MAG: protein kinase [Oscillatoria princeps RMCB-10]|nr:protein kinase [Oscillatoria princeps RMCB-10]